MRSIPQSIGARAHPLAGVIARRGNLSLAAIALFALALLVRLAVLPAPGNTSDLSGLIRFGSQVAVSGPHALYDAPDLANFTNNFTYLPAIPYLLAATFRLWTWLAGLMAWATSAAGPTGAWSPPAEPPYPVAATLVKLWAIAADLAVGWLIYVWVRRRAGARWAMAGAAGFLLTPGVVYDSAWWGQVDSVFTCFVLLALHALSSRRTVATWLWLALAVLTKPQSVVAIPIVALVTLLRDGPRAFGRGAVAASALAVLVAAPFWATGRLDRLAAAYLHATDAYPRVSVNAYNVWYAAGGAGGGILVGRDDTTIATTIAAAGLSYRQIGLLSLLALLTLAVWHLRPLDLAQWRSPARGPASEPAWLLAAAGLYLGFFMLPTQIHERYLFPVLPLLCLLLYRHPLIVAAFGVLSLTFFANLVRVVPWDLGVVAVLDATGLTPERVAWLNVWALGLLTALLLRPPASSLRAPAGVRRPQLANGCRHVADRADRLVWHSAERAAFAALTLSLAIGNVAVQARPAPPKLPQVTAGDYLLLLVCLFSMASATTWLRGWRVRRS